MVQGRMAVFHETFQETFGQHCTQINEHIIWIEKSDDQIVVVHSEPKSWSHWLIRFFFPSNYDFLQCAEVLVSGIKMIKSDEKWNYIENCRKLFQHYKEVLSQTYENINSLTRIIRWLQGDSIGDKIKKITCLIENLFAMEKGKREQSPHLLGERMPTPHPGTGSFWEYVLAQKQDLLFTPGSE